MGFVGEGWTETKKEMEVIERIRKDIDRNMAVSKAASQHSLISSLKGSKSKILRILGDIIEYLDKVAAANGYKNYYNIYPEPYREVKKAPEIKY
jgi:hypothetical protein